MFVRHYGAHTAEIRRELHQSELFRPKRLQRIDAHGPPSRYVTREQRDAHDECADRGQHQRIQDLNAVKHRSEQKGRAEPRRFATFAHAISSTNATAAMSVASGAWKLPKDPETGAG